MQDLISKTYMEVQEGITLIAAENLMTAMGYAMHDGLQLFHNSGVFQQNCQLHDMTVPAPVKVKHRLQSKRLARRQK